MKKFEYKIVNVRAEVQKVRQSPNPRTSEGDEVLIHEIINAFGQDGWHLMNPPNVMELYLEREIEG